MHSRGVPEREREYEIRHMFHGSDDVQVMLMHIQISLTYSCQWCRGTDHQTELCPLWLLVAPVPNTDGEGQIQGRPDRLKRHWGHFACPGGRIPTRSGTMPGKLVDLGKRKKGKKKKKKVRGKTTVHREGHEGRSNKRVAGEQRMGSISVQDHGGIRLEMFYLVQ